MWKNLFVNSILLLVVISCGEGDEKTLTTNKATKSLDGLLQAPFPTDTYDLGYSKLSEYGFFKQPLNTLVPINEQVVPYELNSPLFSDYTSKKRFIYFPAGTKASFNKDEEVLDFPLGTVIIKNFYYKKDQLADSDQDKIIETRLLVLDSVSKKWQTLPYIWNEEQTEAYLYILGKDIQVTFNKEPKSKPITYTYAIPNINSCKNCHINNSVVTPIGPSPMQLHKTNPDLGGANQLTYLINKDFLTGIKDIAQVTKMANYHEAETGTIDKRARAYLHANCAHCHRAGGSAKTSGLHLNYTELDEYKVGVNKHPVAAGQGSGNLNYDIVKGDPDASILVYRMSNTEPNVVMPEVGKALVHEEGVALVRQWIKEMKAHDGL